MATVARRDNDLRASRIDCGGVTNLGVPHIQPNSYFGNPVLGILEGIYGGFHPSYGVSSSVSGWVTSMVTACSSSS